jgi:hypothetical protein
MAMADKGNADAFEKLKAGGQQADFGTSTG